MSERMLDDAALRHVIGLMSRGNFTVEYPDVGAMPSIRECALCPPPQPRILFGGIPASHVGVELLALLQELEQLRAQVKAGRGEALGWLDQLLKSELKKHGATET